MMSDSVVNRNSRKLQSRTGTSMAESEGYLSVPHKESLRGFGKEHVMMRLRLIDGNKEVAVLEVASVEALRNQLVHVRERVGDQLFTSQDVRVHLWHDAGWWSLSDDLSQFFTWIIETGVGTLDEARTFTTAPLSRAAWLYEAAWQMKKLLEIATEVRPKEKQT